MNEEAWTSEKETDEPEWIIKYEIEKKKESIGAKKKEIEEKLERIRKDEARRISLKKNRENFIKKKRLGKEKDIHEECDDEHFLVDDYNSDDEYSKSFHAKLIDTNNFSPQVLQLLQK